MTFWAIVRLALNLLGGGGSVMIGSSIIYRNGDQLGKLLGFHLLGAGLYNLISGILFITSNILDFNTEQLISFGPYYTVANALEVVPAIMIILYVLGFWEPKNLLNRGN